MRRAAIGVSAHLGWAATATLVAGKAGVRVLRTDRIETAEPGDREALEPFHVAGGFHGLDRVPPPRHAKRVLEKGLARQRRTTARAVAKLADALGEEGYRLAFAGILVSRGRPAGSFEQAVGSHTQIHVEEGLAVRESFRRALVDLGAKVADLDQKSLWTDAADVFGRSQEQLLAELRGARPEAGGAWRKEEQSAALAAWVAVAGRGC